jgi:hypothetical protein
MGSRPYRYRITVTPVEDDGHPCDHRCSIEFEHRATQDWMQLLETTPRHRQLGADERAGVLISSRLLHDIAQRHRHAGEDPFAPLEPALERFIAGLDPRR